MTTRTPRNLAAIATAATLLATLAAPGRATAQGEVLFPGSTAEGDILRGAGFFARGAGQYNLYTAMAEQIHVQTWMTLNEYLYESIRFENAERARRDRIAFEKRLANLNKIRDRIANDPEPADVTRGSALNADLEALMKFNPSSYRSDSVPLDSDVVRKLPFFSGQYQATVSLARVNPTGRRWPIAMNRPEFAKERRDYEQALDRVLELQGEGKTTRDAVLRLRETARALETRLQQVEDHITNRTLYNDARNAILTIQKAAEAMQVLNIDKMYGELDRYDGITVHDLVQFMRKWNLRFGVPELGEERSQYPVVHAALEVQLRELRAQVSNTGVEPGRDRDSDRGLVPDPPPPGR